MLARGLLDTLRAVYETEDNCIAVLDAMSRLSEDPEPSVRSELMEQVPHVAVYCQENKDAFLDAVPQYILPMVVRYQNDANSQVIICSGSFRIFYTFCKQPLWALQGPWPVVQAPVNGGKRGLY